MKARFLAPILLLLNGCALTDMDLGAAFTTNEQQALTAPLTRAELLQDPAFNAEYQAFVPSRDDLRKIAALRGKGVMVFFGTWCHDSQREVPRLLKLLDEARVNPAWLQLVAVDHNKQEPSGLYKQYKLRYTPTIVVLDQGIETHRMVERPKRSIASDLTGL
ncbi:TlpA family protein disulfide reductase [Bowmanella denitrificans]|uniref:TlpA family protein disulfide reductase n=1 Tax=Bowmanella denitrificans TaxID=366582 RepID=UPI000C9B35CB|nr:thioredoxin family protein [Bowmanella denitrificans]